MAVFAQIRDYVPIVKPVLDFATLESLAKLETDMRSDGYKDLADEAKAFLSGSFGSGIVFIAPNGDNFVITNRHVVIGARTADLDFQRLDGSEKTYKGCAVVAVDEAVDIALIAFPAGERPFKEGPSLSLSPIEDGMEVWTAGFPGLGEKPSWQLGKGNVSNSALKQPELVDPTVTTLIQHTAQVDPGNSGGPLLVADPKSPGRYRIIGINTWKVSNRQATNLSIPAQAVRRFLDARLSVLPPGKDALEARCRDFAALFGADEVAFEKSTMFISNDYVAARGETALRKALASASSKDRNSVLEAYFGFSPVEGMRLAIAWELRSRIGASAALSFASVGGDPGSASPVSVKFSAGGADFESSWEIDQGRWQIRDLRLAEIVAKKPIDRPRISDGPRIDKSPYIALLEGALAFPQGEGMPSFLTGADLKISISPFLAARVEFGLGMPMDAADEYYVPLEAVVSGIGRLPVTNGSWALTPYGAVGLGFFGDADVQSRWIAVLDAGIEMQYKANDGVGPVYALDIGYRRDITLHYITNEAEPINGANVFFFGLGYGI
jgi:serine protease Do